MRYGEVEKDKWYYDGLWNGSASSSHDYIFTYVMKALSDRFDIDDPRDGTCAVCEAFIIKRDGTLKKEGDFYLWQSGYEFKEVKDPEIISKLEDVYKEFNENPNKAMLRRFVDNL